MRQEPSGLVVGMVRRQLGLVSPDEELSGEDRSLVDARPDGAMDGVDRAGELAHHAEPVIHASASRSMGAAHATRLSLSEPLAAPSAGPSAALPALRSRPAILCIHFGHRGEEEGSRDAFPLSLPFVHRERVIAVGAFCVGFVTPGALVPLSRAHRRFRL